MGRSHSAFRHALCTSMLILLAVLGGCGGPADIIVNLPDWAGNAERLRVRTTLNGQVGSEQYVPRGDRRFVVRLPEGASGTVQIDLAALDSTGCKTASGSATQQVPGGLRSFVEITIPLSTHVPPLCAISVVISNGSGRVTSQPEGIDCREGGLGICSIDVAQGNPLVVQATPGRRSFGGTFSGACTGSPPCTLSVTRSQELGVYFTTAACSVDGWCWYHPLPTGNSLNSIWGSGASDVWAVGGQGTLMHYDGIAWNGLQSVTQSDLFAIWGSGPRDVWAVGSAGTVLHFDGQSWTADALGLPSTLKGVWGSGPRDVWAVGSGGTLVRYNGSQWLAVDVGVTVSLNAIWGSSPNDIWVVGDGNTNLHFDGVRWSPFALPASMSAYALFGTSAADIWAGGTSSLLRYNGVSWSSVGNPSGVAIRGIYSSEPSRLWTVGGYESLSNSYGFIQSWNGTTLSVAVNGMRPNFNAIWGASANDVWAVGGYPGQFESAGIWHWDGLKWTSLFNPLAGRATLYDIRQITADDLWAVGDAGAMLRWDSRVVRAMNSGTNQTLSSLWPVSPTQIWAVTGSSNILRWDGSTWTTPYNSGASYYWTDIWGSSPNNIWFSGSFYSSTSGQYSPLMMLWNGSTFSTQTLSTNGWLAAVWGRSPTEIWAVGRLSGAGTGPVVYRYTGASWNAVSVLGGSFPLLDVWGSANGEVWAVGNGGGLCELQGSSLNNRPSGTTETLVGTHSFSGPEAWAVGATGTILRRNSGGWTPVKSGTVRHLQRVLAASSDDAWAVGVASTILRYQP